MVVGIQHVVAVEAHEIAEGSMNQPEGEFGSGVNHNGPPGDFLAT
jgi:hypothetical protein